MRRIVGFLFVAVVGAAVMPLVAGSEPAAGPGLARVPAGIPMQPRPGSGLDLVLTLDHPASAGLEARLAALGSWSWTARHLPVAAVRIPAVRLDRLRHVDGVRAIYPNRPLVAFDSGPDPSSPGRSPDPPPSPARPGLAPDAGFGAAVPIPNLGVTGKGVTVAIVDTGVDFTHPDLAPAMRANVKMSPFGAVGPTAPDESLPNTDTTSGHGTHIAGDVAGRGIASAGAYQGTAPGASLVGLGAGEGLNVESLAVVEAYDWILEHRQADGIRVVNNSFGMAAFGPFDPDEPINQATRAAADAGLVVVFAQGNDGDELTMNSYGAAPWVIPVAAGTRAGGVTDFSAGGLDADVLEGCFDCETAGDPRQPLHMGQYHPAVAALGENVVGPRAAATIVPFYGVRRDVALPPGQQARYTIQSGTSVASPETAGVVALLLEASPSLSPADVRRILQITARPIAGVPFFRQGYGTLDTADAVGLARWLARQPPADVGRILDQQQATRDSEVLAGLAHPLHTTAWSQDIPVSNSGASHSITVDPGTGRLKVVTAAFAPPFVPAPTHAIIVRDAAGLEVGRSAPRAPGSSPATVLDLDLTRRSDLTWGTWAVSVDEGEAVPPDAFNSARATVAATFAQPQKPERTFTILPHLPLPPR
jgi:subtilisin family serine protease